VYMQPVISIYWWLYRKKTAYSLSNVV